MTACSGVLELLHPDGAAPRSVVLGSASLLGGHGTIIAWSPELAARGLAGGPEIGVAMATLGLVVASLIGGPIGAFLIERGRLTSTDEEPNPVGLSEPPPEPITRNALMRTLLVVFICILLGFLLQRAILGHANYTGVPRDTPMARALFAVDELCGFLVACALVRPSRSLHDLEVSSVRKKLKDKAFARGVSREDVTRGAEEIGVPLDEHIAFVLAALRPHEQTLGLGQQG